MSEALVDVNTFDDYEVEAHKTKTYPDCGHVTVYPALALAGEVGEYANKIKKVVRDHNGVMTGAQKTDLLLELGDALWYLTMAANSLGATLGDVASMNIFKLRERYGR